jgi:hypothetical protein
MKILLLAFGDSGVNNSADHEPLFNSLSEALAGSHVGGGKSLEDGETA